MKFLDEAKIFVQSGNGGPGSLSFRREKFIEYGGPDGGNGGKGGNILFVAVDNLNTLIDYRYQQHFKAPHGQGGMGRSRTGSHGHDLILKVPVGTQIFDDDKETLLADLDHVGQEILLLKGGDGGFGNEFYKTSTNRAPRRTTPGWPGEERWVWLRLKLIADVGIIGLPNAGKSTFLAATTRAKPKIANYPFTTLRPNLGVVSSYDREFVIADLPGLIENAHQGVGLGHKFLGHVERCSCLLHIIDATDEDVCKNYQVVRQELTFYEESLLQKPEIVVLNKCDSLDHEMVESKLKDLKEVIPFSTLCLTMSGVSGQGVSSVLQKLSEIVLDTRNKEGDKDPWLE